MNYNIAEKIFTDYANNIDKVEKELGRKLSKQEILDNIFDEFVRMSEIEEKAIDKTLKGKDIDLNKPKAKFEASFEGDTVKKTAQIETLSNAEREKRLETRNALFRNFIRISYESFKEKDTAIVSKQYYGGPSRNTEAFLGDHVILKDGLKGTDVAKMLAGEQTNEFGKKLTNQEKQDLMAHYIDGVAEETVKICRESISDNDFLNKMEAMHEAGRVFSCDTVSDIFQGITKTELNKDISDKYLADRGLFQQTWSYFDAQFTKIASPLYLKITAKSQEALSDAAHSSGYYNPKDVILYSQREAESIEAEMKFGKMAVFTPLTLPAYHRNFHMTPGTKDFYKNVEKVLGIDKNSKIYGENGEAIDFSKTEKENIFKENKIVIARNVKGKDFYMTVDKSDFIRYKEIPEKTDNTAKYKEMLNVLNSGTRLFVRSSDEYKNMRNILGQLMDGKHLNEETELLGRFEENMNRYIDNFDSKKSKSEIAFIRKECVDKVKDIFGDMYIEARAQDINTLYKGKEEYVEDKEIEQEHVEEVKQEDAGPVRKSIVIEEAKDKFNSDAAFEEKQEEKAMEKESKKEMDEDYYEEQAPTGEGIYEDEDDYIASNF